MPLTTPCPRCGQVGWVRAEMIVRAGYAARSFECGACNHVWRVLVDERSTASDNDRRRTPRKK